MTARLALPLVLAVSAAIAAVAHGRPASDQGLLVLLADNRIVRVSAGGKIEAETRLAAAPATTIGAGRSLALTPGGRRAWLLLRAPAGRRDELALLDVRTLAVRRRVLLSAGVRYRGVLIGPVSRRLYLYGNRPGQIVDRTDRLRDESAVVTIIDPSGKLVVTRVARPALGHDWWTYWGALSLDERRLYLSYHGGCGAQSTQLCTTGADWFELAGERLRSCTETEGQTGNVGCIEEPHGIVEPLQGGRLLAANGEAGILEIDADGNVVRTYRGVSATTHLMDFALDSGRRLVYTSSCAGTGTGPTPRSSSRKRDDARARRPLWNANSPRPARHRRCRRRHDRLPRRGAGGETCPRLARGGTRHRNSAPRGRPHRSDRTQVRVAPPLLAVAALAGAMPPSTVASPVEVPPSERVMAAPPEVQAGRRPPSRESRW